MTESRTSTEPRPDIGTKSLHSGQCSAVRPPAPAEYDLDWRVRIETARQARDQARKARGDGPLVFRHPPLPL